MRRVRDKVTTGSSNESLREERKGENEEEAGWETVAIREERGTS